MTLQQASTTVDDAPRGAFRRKAAAAWSTLTRGQVLPLRPSSADTPASDDQAVSPAPTDEVPTETAPTAQVSTAEATTEAPKAEVPIAEATRAQATTIEAAATPVSTAHVKYDGDILHIIEQYPGCDDARVLGMLRARVAWFGRGTWIDKMFRPSPGTVHAAGRRLEATGKIKSKTEQSEDGQVLRFYPNNPVWADSDPKA